MARAKTEDFKVEDFYFFKVKNMWRYFWTEHPAFWCVCAYLFVEYFRPQLLFPAIDILPWAQLFLVLSLGLSFIDRKSVFNLSGIFVLIVLLTFWILLSKTWAYNKAYFSDHLDWYIQWPIIIFCISRIISTKERFYILLMVLFLCSLKISLGTAMIWAKRGFAFTDWGIMGPSGYFQNSGELSIQMLIAFALSVSLLKCFYKTEGRIGKIILIVATIAPVMTILGASSRGSQIALVLIVAMWFRKSLFSLKKIIAMALVVLVAWSVFPEEQKERFTSIGEDQSSIQRKLYWSHGFDMMIEHPFTGVGFYNFIPYYNDHFPDDVLYGSAQLAHNIFVQVGADLGFPGLLIYLLIIWSALLAVLRSRTKRKGADPTMNELYMGLAYGFIGFLLAGQFVSVVYYPFMWIYLSFALAYGNIIKSR